jgi:hypothetical protein
VWLPYGEQGISSGPASYNKLAIYQDTLYLAYGGGDGTPLPATVATYNTTANTWEPVGPAAGFSAGDAE